MANQRQTLLESIATIIADYRQGEIPNIHFSHVNRWVRQFAQFGFNDEDQVIILGEMERILKRYYISRKIAEEFITNFLSDHTEKLENFQYLPIQRKGSSQNDLLNLWEQILQSKHGLGFSDCGRSPVVYVYLDDCLYTGNTMWRDIDAWISKAARETNLYLIFFAVHTDGWQYSQRQIRQKAQEQQFLVETTHFWRHQFHNSRWQRESSQFDCFWPCQVSGDELVDRYIQEVNQRRQNLSYTPPPLFRPDNMPTQDSIFSSPAARQIIESAFLKAGAYIVSKSKNPNQNIRPLGYDYFESLGFGSIFVTYRNIANNCPLALWWGDSNQTYPLNAWYPLFPRIVNTSISEQEEV